MTEGRQMISRKGKRLLYWGRVIAMKIEWTGTAEQKIEEKLNGLNGHIKLKYDTEGTGCVMNGVTALWLVDEPDSDDERIGTNGRPVYVEKSKMIFMDEQMKIDFVPEVNSFQLKSPNQMLNPRMSFMNRTNQ